MRVIPPIPITDAMLKSSSVIEAAPAAYAADATYPAGAQVSVGAIGALLTVYRCLQAGSKGKEPAANPSWWEAIGTTYGYYDKDATYGLGGRVIDRATHEVFESQIAGNQGKPLAEENKWLSLGASNRHAMFDYKRNNQTVSTSDIVVVLRLDQRADSLALCNVLASKTQVRMMVGGKEVYSTTKKMITRKSYGWRDFFFGRFKQTKNLLLTNLPLYRYADIEVSLTRASAGPRKCGACVVGMSEYLGEVQYDPESDHLNFSIIDRNKWGDARMMPIRAVPKIKMVVEFDRNRTDRLLDVREALDAVPAVWAGIDDFNDGYFRPMFLLGPYRQFTLNLREPKRGIANLEIEEI